MDNAKLYNNNSLLKTMLKEPEGNHLIECLTCGICVSRCSWYDNEGGPNPRLMVRLAVLGLDDVLASSSMLWDCLLCNRCIAECPMGIDMDLLVRRARALSEADNLIPPDFKKGIPLRLETGNVNGITKEDFVETLEWLSEETQDEYDDPDIYIPIDQSGAKYLYLPNPREINLIPLHLTAMFKLFFAFNESWTMASKCSDVTNWGYYIGDDEVMAKMVMQIVEGAEELNIETLVLSECGHGYRILRHMASDLIGRKPKFHVMSMPELVWEKVDSGIIKLDPSATHEAVAYHDPCNIGRKSGVFDAPRNLLAHSCAEVIELFPNRMHAVCCGGGGGLLQDSTSKQKRMLTGKAKAEQIRAAGARIVATSCLSCQRQLSEISAHYNLGITVPTVVNLAAKALVIE